MGQIKNIKLHIVTDIKIIKRSRQDAEMEPDGVGPDDVRMPTPLSGKTRIGIIIFLFVILALAFYAHINGCSIVFIGCMVGLFGIIIYVIKKALERRHWIEKETSADTSGDTDAQYLELSLWQRYRQINEGGLIAIWTAQEPPSYDDDKSRNPPPPAYREVVEEEEEEVPTPSSKDTLSVPTRAERTVILEEEETG